MAGKGATEIHYTERLLIEEMLRSHCKTRTIANSLERSHTGIKQEIRRAGGKENYTAENAQKISVVRRESKLSALRKGFSEKEITLIRAGLSEGWSVNKLCETIGCSHWRLTGWLKKQDIKTIPKNYIAFETRITNLECQIEIILNYIEEINDRKNH